MFCYLDRPFNKIWPLKKCNLFGKVFIKILLTTYSVYVMCCLKGQATHPLITEEFLSLSFQPVHSIKISYRPIDINALHTYLFWRGLSLKGWAKLEWLAQLMAKERLGQWDWGEGVDVTNFFNMSARWARVKGISKPQQKTSP